MGAVDKSIILGKQNPNYSKLVFLTPVQKQEWDAFDASKPSRAEKEKRGWFWLVADGLDFPIFIGDENEPEDVVYIAEQMLAHGK